MKDGLYRLLKSIEKGEIFIVRILLAIMIVSVSLQVFFRYILNNPLTWPEELAGFLLIWLVFLTADILLKRNGHIRVDVLTKYFSEKGREIIAVMVNLLIFIFLIHLVITSIKLEILQIHHGVGAALRIPKAFYTLAATISGMSMILSILYAEWTSIEKLKSSLRRS